MPMFTIRIHKNHEHFESVNTDGDRASAWSLADLLVHELARSEPDAEWSASAARASTLEEQHGEDVHYARDMMRICDERGYIVEEWTI